MGIIKEKKNIKSETELLALTAAQAEKGLMFLKNFVANTPQNIYRELIAKS